VRPRSVRDGRETMLGGALGLATTVQIVSCTAGEAEARAIAALGVIMRSHTFSGDV
jgi:hypothetical protein